MINRPENKLAALPKGARLRKRPLPSLTIGRQLRNARTSNATARDLDDYQLPVRAAHTVVIKVTAKTPFMAIIKRARHALDNGPQKTKGLPLTARIESLGVGSGGKTREQAQGFITDTLDDVVLIATGRAIQKVLEVGSFMRRNEELVVVFRTRTVSAIDDIEMDEDVDMEDQVRVRQVSCVEVGVRWK